MADNYHSINGKDAQILKKLGGEIAEIGALPQMAELKRLWKKLNALEAERPMLLGKWVEIARNIIHQNSNYRR
jgi:hypothetical protein